VTKTIFVVGHYGFGNVGDEAILCSMLSQLRELQPALEVTVATGAPARTAATLGVRTVQWSDARAVFESVTEADLVIIGGGGIFHDYMGLSLDGFLTDNHWGVSFFAGPAMMALLRAKPLMLYAVGVGPLFSDHAKALTKLACDAAIAITVRDAASKQVLESIGVAPERIEVTTDPAFAFPSICPAAANCPATIGPSPRVAVVLRPWHIGTSQAFWEREVAAGLELFRRRRGGSLTFIPFEFPTSNSENDLTIARKVSSLLSEQDNVTISEIELSPQQAQLLLAGCDLVVGMRLHSLILAMQARVPIVSLSYDNKVDQVMELTGMRDFRIDVRSIDATALAATMAAAIDARRTLSLEPLAVLARRNATIACDILDKAESRPVLDPAIANLLARGLQAQLRDAYELRSEVRRLHEIVEFYQSAHAQPDAAAPRLAARIAELEASLELNDRTAASEKQRSESLLLDRIGGLTTALREARNRVASAARQEADLAARLETSQRQLRIEGNEATSRAQVLEARLSELNNRAAGADIEKTKLAARLTFLEDELRKQFDAMSPTGRRRDENRSGR